MAGVVLFCVEVDMEQVRFQDPGVGVPEIYASLNEVESESDLAVSKRSGTVIGLKETL